LKFKVLIQVPFVNPGFGKSTMIRRVMLLVPLVLLLSSLGCGSQSTNGRFPISGQVTLHGNPLETGTIEFETSDGSHRSGATIGGGKYSIPANQGLLPGTYVVRLSAIESSQPAPAAGPPGPESMGAEQANRDLIPVEFNRESKLTHEAGAGKPVTFDVTIP